jgi:hypothetical protein
MKYISLRTTENSAAPGAVVNPAHFVMDNSTFIGRIMPATDSRLCARLETDRPL